jgi:hypothetical protein
VKRGLLEKDLLNHVRDHVSKRYVLLVDHATPDDDFEGSDVVVLTKVRLAHVPTAAPLLLPLILLLVLLLLPELVLLLLLLLRRRRRRRLIVLLLLVLLLLVLLLLVLQVVEPECVATHTHTRTHTHTQACTCARTPLCHTHTSTPYSPFLPLHKVISVVRLDLQFIQKLLGPLYLRVSGLNLLDEVVQLYGTLLGSELEHLLHRWKPKNSGSDLAGILFELYFEVGCVGGWVVGVSGGGVCGWVFVGGCVKGGGGGGALPMGGARPT